MKRAAAAVIALLAALLSACGSTVQSAHRAPSAGDGLSAGSGAQSSDGAAASASSPVSGAAAANGSSPAAGEASGKRAVTGNAAAVASKAATGPIRLGFVNTNVSNAAAFGIKLGSTFSNQAIYDALIAEVNKAGGINGRKIEPVYANTDTASANWGTDFQAACSTFTQDKKVAAVLGYVFVWLDGFEDCLAKAGVPHLFGGYQPGDRQEQRDHPLLFSTTHPDLENQWLTVMAGAIASGRLTPKNKLGIFVDDCAHDQRAFEAVVPAYLNAHKIPFEAFKTGCSSGASDNGQAASQIDAAALQFRTHGDDTVAISGVPALLFATQAESQHWYPSYLMAYGGAAFEGNVPNDQLANFHGFGWIPAVDVNPSHQPGPPNAAQKRCLSMLAAHSVVPSAVNDYMLAYVSCDALFLYADALALTNGHPDGPAVVQALASVAPKFESASTYGGKLQSSSLQRGGAAAWRPWAFSTGCNCFVYTGSENPLRW